MGGSKRHSSCAPILLIGFNRPDFMRAQIAAVREARPLKLYVAVDGPRPDRPDEAEKCRAVRDCVKFVDWPCEVKTLFQMRILVASMRRLGQLIGSLRMKNRESFLRMIRSRRLASFGLPRKCCCIIETMNGLE